MEVVWPDPDLSVFLSLGLAGPFLGLAGWINRPRLGLGIAALLAVWSAASFIAKQPVQAWGPPAALAVTYISGLIVRWRRDILIRVAASRQAHASLFLVIGPLLVCAWASHLDSQIPITEMPAAEQPRAAPTVEPIATNRYVLTDRGRSIRLYTRAALSQAESAQADRAVGGMHQFSLIRASEPDTVCNCHGWIFTDGQYWIRSNDVDSILSDNDYHQIESPRAGDLIVYRDGLGQVIHSGLVRLVNDGLILVESKWGLSGRYLHQPADQPYAYVWNFYRSSRHGHVLNMAEENPAATGSAMEN